MLILKEEWQSHEKILKAVYLARSPQVKHFWFELLSASANANTDGVIEVYRVPGVAQSCGIDADTADRYLSALLECSVKEKGAALFHDRASLAKCTACKDELKKAGRKPGPDDVVVHDFLKHNPGARDKTPMGQLRQKRKNWLKRNGKGLKLEVYARDQGLCRYCGCRPIEDGDGPTSLEHDHVDPNPTLPNIGNFTENVVISCRACNARKGQRTPAEAGMELLAAGTTRQDVLDGRARYVSTPSEIPATEAPASTGVGAGSGAARGRVGRGSGPGRSRVGTGAPTATRSTSRVPRQAAISRVLRPESLPP